VKRVVNDFPRQASRLFRQQIGAGMSRDPFRDRGAREERRRYNKMLSLATVPPFSFDEYYPVSAGLFGF